MRERDALKVGERLAGADAGQRPPVEARQLAAHLVDEARLVGVDAGRARGDDQVGDVVGAVLRDREEKEREAAARVLVDPPEEAEVEERQPAVLREQDVPECGSAWYTPSTTTWST